MEQLALTKIEQDLSFRRKRYNDLSRSEASKGDLFVVNRDSLRVHGPTRKVSFSKNEAMLIPGITDQLAGGLSRRTIYLCLGNEIGVPLFSTSYSAACWN